ncbi:MAG: dihydrolipoyl dehydrogenase [Bdellovibrionales bacterium]|nr:dihydrolipoyl dehydrogenase [Bdellovibrionales bacterium]
MNVAQEFDVVFIGAGPGGYTGAIKAAQLGLMTAIVEKGKTLGGTCLNVGCIPSKALLDSSVHFSFFQHDAAKHGVVAKSVSLDLPAMMARKDQIVKELTNGVAFLMKKNKITVFQGVGHFTDSNTLEVQGSNNDVIKFKSAVIATGSTVIELSHLKFDGSTVISSTEALTLPKVPKHLIVVGAGAIGLEMGSVWKRLGADVTVVEAAPKICGPMDAQVSKELHKVLVKQGMKILTSTKVVAADVKPGSVKLKMEGEVTEIEGDVCLVAVGRKPYTDGLGLDKAGVEVNPRGRVAINEKFQTNVPSIYAIGDAVEGAMLAHKAEEEGVAVAEIISGHHAHVNYLTVPSVIYTWPEVAGVGYTEEQLKEKGIAFKKGQFPFSANARAKAIGETNGFVKFLADEKTDRILGCHVLGPRASDVLAEAVVAMEFSASSEDVGLSFHAHPTLSEVMREAALAVSGRARQM